MKIKKLAGLLLAAAVAAAAMMPAASAAPADFGLIASEDDIRYTNGQCEVSFNNGALTVSRPTGWSDPKVGAHMMWTEKENKEVDITQLPYLCWDVSGSNFDVVIRFADGDKGLVSLQDILSKTGGIAAGKGSVNFQEYLQASDLAYDGGAITLQAIVYWTFADPGAGATFNKLYFSASELKDDGSGDDTTKGEEPTTTTKGDDSTSTTTAAKTTAKPTANPSTGEAAPAALAVLAVAAVGTVVFCARKRA